MNDAKLDSVHEIDTDDLMDSDDDSSEEELPAVDELKMRVALDEQNANPRAYDFHVAAVELAMSSGNVVHIEEACLKMSEEFPMISSYWLKFIHHVKKKFETCDSINNNINNLYLRGLDDYFSVDLQLDYLTWILSSNNTEKIRTAFENAIKREGLHPIDGSSIWYMYKQYETAVFTSLNSVEQVPEKLEPVISIIQRYLMFPNNHLQETYATLLELCKECPNIDVTEAKQNYEKNLHLYSELQHFEEQLKTANNDESKKLQIYYEYIDAAEIQTDISPTFMASLYQRATTELCLNTPLWLRYCKYMIKLYDASTCNLSNILKESNTNNTTITSNASTEFLSSKYGEPLNTIIRSLRNCPGSLDLRIMKLRFLEKIENVSINDINKDFEVALYNAESNTLRLWMAYLEILWRMTDTTDTSQVKLLRKSFSLAIDTLTETWSIEADPTFEIYKFWARLEYTKLNDPSQGREIWNTILSNGNNKTLSYLWIELAQMEFSSRGGPVYCRRIYRRAVSECDDPALYEAWIAFERVHGSADDVEHCITTCQLNSRTSNWNQINQGETFVAEDSYENRKMKRQYHQRTTGANNAGHNRDYKKNTKPFVNKKTDWKSKNDSSIGSSSVSRTSKKRQVIDNMDKTKQEPSPKKIKHDDVNNDLPSVADMKIVDSTSPDNDNDNSSKRVIHDSSKDDVTVFVSNLDYKITEEDIKSALDSKADLGIVEIRLVKTLSGKSRGYCYVQLRDAAAVAEALTLDRTPLLGRPMFISRCQGEKDSRKHGFKYADTLEENKIFIRGLPFELTEAELKEMFGKFGELKDVRLVTNRNGKSKGLAYVEYTLASAASAAIMQTDNTVIQGLKISVALSAPPSRQLNRDNKPLDRSKLLGGATRVRHEQGNPKAKISFIPRSVQKTVLSKVTKEKVDDHSEPMKTEMITETTVASKSNDDFRKMILDAK